MRDEFLYTTSKSTRRVKLVFPEFFAVYFLAVHGLAYTRAISTYVYELLCSRLSPGMTASAASRNTTPCPLPPSPPTFGTKNVPARFEQPSLLLFLFFFSSSSPLAPRGGGFVPFCQRLSLSQCVAHPRSRSTTWAEARLPSSVVVFLVAACAHQ